MATTVEDAIRDKLSGTSAVTDTLATTTSIYPLQAPQGAAFPFITYQRISSAHEIHMTGVTGLADATVQIDCWAATYAEVKDTAEAVRQTLNAFSGAAGTPSADINLAMLTDQRDDLIGGVDGSDQPRSFNVSQDWTVWHTET